MFASTVDTALGEVARRMVLGMSCECAISHSDAKKQADRQHRRPDGRAQGRGGHRLHEGLIRCKRINNF
jgi:hypothetical protein